MEILEIKNTTAKIKILSGIKTWLEQKKKSQWAWRCRKQNYLKTKHRENTEKQWVEAFCTKGNIQGSNVCRWEPMKRWGHRKYLIVQFSKFDKIHKPTDSRNSMNSQGE